VKYSSGKDWLAERCIILANQSLIASEENFPDAIAVVKRAHFLDKIIHIYVKYIYMLLG
jgi:hypothetical protein